MDICNDPGHHRRRRARSIPVRTGHGEYAHRSFIYDELDFNTLRAGRKNKRKSGLYPKLGYVTVLRERPYCLNYTAGNVGETFTLNVHT